MRNIPQKHHLARENAQKNMHPKVDISFAIKIRNCIFFLFFVLSSSKIILVVVDVYFIFLCPTKTTICPILMPIKLKIKLIFAHKGVDVMIKNVLLLHLKHQDIHLEMIDRTQLGIDIDRTQNNKLHRIKILCWRQINTQTQA